MTDISAEQIKSRLDALKNFNATSNKSDTSRQRAAQGSTRHFWGYATAGLAGLAFGVMTMIAAPQKLEGQRLTPATLDWVVLEISENRDMTPLAARNLLSQKMKGLQ